MDMLDMLDMLEAILMTVMAMLLLILVRIEIVLRVRMKALDIAHKRAQADIKAGESEWMHHFIEQESFGSYDRMLCEIHKWTFSQFYPGW